MTNAAAREKAERDVLQAAANLGWIARGDSVKELRDYLARAAERRAKRK